MPRVPRVSFYSILSPGHSLSSAKCFCLAISLGMVWSSSPVVLLSTRWDTSCRSCLVKCEPSPPNTTLGNSKQGNVISWIIFFEFPKSAATQGVLHPFGQIVHGLQDVLMLLWHREIHTKWTPHMLITSNWRLLFSDKALGNWNSRVSDILGIAQIL